MILIVGEADTIVVSCYLFFKGVVKIKRQAFLLALMISLLLLGGCKSSEQLEEKYIGWRDSFLEQPVLDIKAEITSVIDETHGEYILLYHRDEAEETVEVLSPELIADVKAHLGEDGTRLSFDGVMLETGAGIGQKLSPLTALPVFMDFLEDGYVKGVWTETAGDRSLIVTELELGDGSRMTLWQDKTDMTPLYAAIRSGSIVEIKIKPIEIT